MKHDKAFDFNKQKPDRNKNKKKTKSLTRDHSNPKPTINPQDNNTLQEYKTVMHKDNSHKELNEKDVSIIDPIDQIEVNNNEPHYHQQYEEIFTVNLLESESIQPDEDMPIKHRNESFGKKYLHSKYIELTKETPTEILTCIQSNLDLVMQDIYNEIINDNFEINPERKCIEDLIITKDKIKIESSIKDKRIKEHEANKISIQRKLSQLEENIKILTLDQLGSSRNVNNSSYTIGNNNTNNDIVEDNIKKAQLKETKDKMELLQQRLSSIDEQIQNLMYDEEQQSQVKKINRQQFLENFEKEKEMIIQRALKYEEEMRHREMKALSSITKAKEKKEKELDTIEKEEEEKRKRSLERKRLRELERIRERNKENSEKVNFLKNHVYDKPANENEYLFKVLENDYKQREENEIKKEIKERKSKMKENYITLEEISEFRRRQREAEMRREAEVEEEQRKLKEQWKQAEEDIPKFESSVMQRIKEEESRNKEIKELEDYKKKIKLKEIKNYSQAVAKIFLPKINENAKKEREDRIKNLNAKNTIQPHKRKHNPILFVKPDPNKPKKCNYDPNLMPMNDYPSDNINRARSRSAKHKIPLDKKPDYLTEMRIKKINEERANSSHGMARRGKRDKTKHWDKMIKNNKNSLMENVEMIKIQAEIIEEQAKMKEKFLHANGEVNVTMQENVSNMYIDAITAKLTILENITKK